MSASGPNHGFGTAITFSTGFCAYITNVDGDGWARTAIETSNNSVTTPFSRTFVPGKLVDHGELSVDLLFDPSTSPPIGSAAETVTVTFPKLGSQTTAATWAASGFLTGFKWTAPMDGAMTATATIKLTGDVTITAGS